jgi:hypothetical protein
VVVEPAGGTFDTDLDLRPLPPPREPNRPIEDYQRLVANPLLGVLSWIVTFALMRESVRRHNLTLFAWGLLFVPVGIVFIQFHCLDCGKTGWLLRSRVHACPATVARRQNGLMRRFHGPPLTIQLAVWFIVLIAALVLGMVALGTRR